MENSLRKPFQGVRNIVRFNWHFYVFAAVAIIAILLLQFNFKPLRIPGNIIIILILFPTIISLGVSAYIYDISGLYKLSWLNNSGDTDGESIVNINAGFDETSLLIKNRFENCDLIVADFYDPGKHTEVSIRRARKAYPVFPGTIQVSTGILPFENVSADKILAIFSAHEIRNSEERITFFKELNRTLKPSGKIYVTEHLRDAANFLAYNIGFFHFYSKASWLRIFHMADLIISKEIKITPFVTTFILEKNGTTS